MKSQFSLGMRELLILLLGIIAVALILFFVFFNKSIIEQKIDFIYSISPS